MKQSITKPYREVDNQPRRNERNPDLQDDEIKVRISLTLKQKAFDLAARQGIKLSELVRRLLQREVSK